MKKLKCLIKKYGILKLTMLLDYRSPCTIRHWLKNGKIPTISKEKVDELFKYSNEGESFKASINDSLRG